MIVEISYLPSLHDRAEKSRANRLERMGINHNTGPILIQLLEKNNTLTIIYVNYKACIVIYQKKKKYKACIVFL